MATSSIIIAFKGTSADEFSEWLLDFDYSYKRGEQIPGFHFVHRGFYDQLFQPRKDGSTAYETIMNAIQRISDLIRAGDASKPVNIWVTGHSLGAAMACLFYAKMQTEDPSRIGATLQDG